MDMIDQRKHPDRPKRITVIGVFLILSNGFMVWASYTSLMHASGVPRPIAHLTALISTYTLFLLLGIFLLQRKNWARITYLIVAPISLILDLILGCFRLGIDNIYDRTPSIIVTITFIALLLSRRSRGWFNTPPYKSEKNALSEQNHSLLEP